MDPYPSPDPLKYVSTMLALHLLNQTDTADLTRSFWALNYTARDIVPLVRGAFDLLVPLAPNEQGISKNAWQEWLTPVAGFLVGLYKCVCSF